MATKITISNNDYVLIDDSSHFLWNDIGLSMPAIPANVHYIIWNGSSGEVQYNDGTGNTDLSSTNDVVGSTSIGELLTWGDTRISERASKRVSDSLEGHESWVMKRIIRDELLMKSDWTQLSDNALSDADKLSWKDYRQSLRDLPSTYAATDAKLVRLNGNGTVEVGTSIEEGTANITGSSNVVVPPSDIFSQLS